jgi:hypothetical protein
MTTRIKLRRDTKANWANVNPILAAGEMGLESGTRRTKIGDGLTPWNGLEYTFGDLEVTGKKINGELGVSIASQDPETWISKVKAKSNWAGTRGVAYDSAGNLYLCGWEETGYDLNNGGGAGIGYLIKFDSQGAVLWDKYISNLSVEGYSSNEGVAVDSDDNVIVTTNDWDSDKFLITKYTSEGEVIWQKTYTDSYINVDCGNVAVDSNNDIVVIGLRDDPNNSNYEAVFAMKVVGTTGAVSWTKTMGRNSNAWQPSLAIDGADNIVIAGMDDDDNNGQANIAKLTSSGSPVWSKTLRNQESEWNGYELTLGSIDADADGNIYFVGSYVVPNFVVDIQGDTEDGRAGLILKMNSGGVVQWSRIVGPGDCNDLGASVVYKAGKLYATFQTERKYYKKDFTRNNFEGYTTQEIVLACYEADTGKVLWGNNFGPEMLWGYANPNGNADNSQDEETRFGRLIAVHGDYVTVAGQAGEYSRVEDNEIRSYSFLAQLPANGLEMDLAGWSYKKTKHGSAYAQAQIEDFTDYTINTTTTITVTGTDQYLPTNTATNVVVELFASGANQWDFKPNGDLALPVGGNIEITRPAHGSVNVVGYFDSYNINNIGNYFNSVTTDADGNQYYVGVWNWHDNSTPNGNSFMPLVVKVNAQGQVEWKVRLSNNYLYTNDAVYGPATTVAYDPASGNIVVVCADSGEGNSEQMLIVDLNPLDGSVVEDHRYSGPADIVVRGMAINTLGERFITGSIEGNNSISFTLTNTMLASTSTVDTVMVPRTLFDGEEAPSWSRGTEGWQLALGNNLSQIDYYTTATGVVQEGSGAAFDITIDGVGVITSSTVNAGGTNYRTGHKILLPYTAFSGTDTNADIILTVTSATNGVIETVAAGYYGSGGGSTGTYTIVTGTNYQVGSGFTIGVQVNANTSTNNLIVYHGNGGTNYVAGDVITFPGTQFGGTSTATDLVITALQVGGFTGDVQPVENTGYAVTARGTSPLTYIRLKFTGANFTAGGPNYTLDHFTDANSFLAKFVSTATTSTSLVWAQWIQKSFYDQGRAVDYDSQGNLYWFSSIYDEQVVGTDTNYDQRAVVTKLSSTGTAVWSKSYNIDGYEGNPSGLQVDSEDRVVISFLNWDNNNSQWNQTVKRLDSNGSALWTQQFQLDGGEGAGGGLALDNDDNIYVNTINYDSQDSVSWTAKLDIQDGDTIWQQETSHEGRDIYTGFQNDTGSIAVDNDKYYVGHYTFDMDGTEGNALAVALPADGSAEDTHHGPFAVNAVSYNVNGGDGDGSFDAPVTRSYEVTTATSLLSSITDREHIRSWIVSDPVSNYPVYTKSDAGIVFGDGTVQTTSGQGLPQVRLNRYNKYTKLKLSDSGKHLYVKNNDQIIEVPTYSEVQFPVGTMITVVNISGGSVYIVAAQDDYRTNLYCPPLDGNEGSDNNINGFRFYDSGGSAFITLLKVEESHSNGSRWIVNGNNAYTAYDINPLNP